MDDSLASRLQIQELDNEVEHFEATLAAMDAVGGTDLDLSVPT